MTDISPCYASSWEYKDYRKYLLDFPETHDPEIDENGETVEAFSCWKRLVILCFSCREPIRKHVTPHCLDPLSRV